MCTTSSAGPDRSSKLDNQLIFAYGVDVWCETMNLLDIFGSLSLLAIAVAISYAEAAVSPKVASVKIIANVTDPKVTRDSCGTVKIVHRALWTCRDTETWNKTSQQGDLPLITNTASWTDFNGDGTPKIQTGLVGADSDGSNPILSMYGGHPKTYPAFFPVLDDECPESGACKDGTRWAVWPNSPPMIASTKDDTTIGYTWIPRSHLDFLTLLNPEPPHTLYKITYKSTSNNNKLPLVSVVNENFWKRHEIGYGDYGNVVRNGVAYLYGQTDDPLGTALAKVSVDHVEDRSQYEYYVNGKWTKSMPGINDSASIISNAGDGGQGTFYYSNYFSSYVWIGQAAHSALADFYITTAPAPEGPWIKPYLIYKGTNGDSSIAGGYSLQAHPGLLKSSDQNGIYLTWTEQFENTTYGAYVTPLVYVTWN